MKKKDRNSNMESSGWGVLGEALAMMLAQSGHEVIAVDKDEKR